MEQLPVFVNFTSLFKGADKKDRRVLEGIRADWITRYHPSTSDANGPTLITQVNPFSQFSEDTIVEENFTTVDNRINSALSSARQDCSPG